MSHDICRQQSSTMRSQSLLAHLSGTRILYLVRPVSLPKSKQVAKCNDSWNNSNAAGNMWWGLTKSKHACFIFNPSCQSVYVCAFVCLCVPACQSVCSSHPVHIHTPPHTHFPSPPANLYKDVHDWSVCVSVCVKVCVHLCPLIHKQPAGLCV